MLETISLIHNSPEWLAFRRTGIGGSDAAAILGKSHFKTNVDIWEEKVGLKQAEDISKKEYVVYGKKAEDSLVKLFEIDFPQYKVKINKRIVYKREKKIVLTDKNYLPEDIDAILAQAKELTDKKTKAEGFLETKTNELFNNYDFKNWDGQIPEHYYIQVLHYFIVTGREFAVVKVRIRHKDKYGEAMATEKHFTYYRKDILADLKFLYLKEYEFWHKYVLPKKRPPLILPSLTKIN